jgi:hypothetical protein
MEGTDVATRTTDSDVYCSMFDLTTTMPLRAADQARLKLIDVDTLSSGALPSDLYEVLYQRIAQLIDEEDYA